MDFHVPGNDYIVIEQISHEDGDAVIAMTDRMRMLLRGRVISVGSDHCVLDGTLVRKSELFPDLKDGCEVLYKKIAEDRMTDDAAYRHRLPDGSYVVYVKLKDIVAVK